MGGIAALLTICVTETQSENASFPMVSNLEPKERLFKLEQPEKASVMHQETTLSTRLYSELTDEDEEERQSCGSNTGGDRQNQGGDDDDTPTINEP